MKCALLLKKYGEKNKSEVEVAVLNLFSSFFLPLAYLLILKFVTFLKSTDGPDHTDTSLTYLSKCYYNSQND